MHNIKNISILKYGLIIAALSLTINIIFYLQFSISDIVFLEHIYSKEIQDGSKLELHYIKNANDNSQITGISFPEMPEDFAYVVLEEDPIISQEFAHYHYDKITLTIYIPKNFDKKENKTVLMKGIVRFGNGKKQEIILGNIVLFKNTDNLNGFTTTHTSYSEDNLYDTTKVANQNISIGSITPDFYDEAEDIIHMKFNDVPVGEINFPFVAAEGEELTFKSQLIINKNDTRRYNVYNIDNYISFTVADGRNGYEPLYNISYSPSDLFSSEKNILNFLKYKGAK